MAEKKSDTPVEDTQAQEVTETPAPDHGDPLDGTKPIIAADGHVVLSQEDIDARQ